MVEEAVKQRIQTVMNQVAAFLSFSPPPWRFVGGSTSFYDRDERYIAIAEPVVDMFIRTNDDVDLDGLIAHETRHAWQHQNNFYPTRQNVREIDARIFAGDWVSQVYPGRSSEFNFQPLDCSLLSPRQRVQRDLQEIPEILLERSQELNTRQQILFQDAFKPQGKPISTAKWIRARMSLGGEAYIWQMWAELRDTFKTLGVIPTQYHSFQSMIYVLKKIGLIEFIREEDSEFGAARRVYDLVDARLDDQSWENPFRAYRS